MVECEYYFGDTPTLQSPGFNRYMVECEYTSKPRCKNRFNVLIDTWWNVNISAKDVVNNAIHVLIDTWWNVNISFRCDVSESKEF